MRRPENYTSLRALLRRAESTPQNDSVAFQDYTRIAAGLTYSDALKNHLYTYLRGILERAQGEKAYTIHTDEAIAEAKVILEKAAFGTFTEAATQLEYDLRSVSFMNSRDSDEFRPQYFTEEGQTAWAKARAVLDKWYDTPYSKERDDEAEDAIEALRLHLQNHHGPLIPVVVGTYQDAHSGVSVRLVWKDEVVVDKGSATADAVAAHIAELGAISIDDFDTGNAGLFPVEIDGRAFVGVSRVELFEWEL